MVPVYMHQVLQVSTFQQVSRLRFWSLVPPIQASLSVSSSGTTLITLNVASGLAISTRYLSIHINPLLPS